MGYLLVNVQLPDSASLERTQKVLDRINDDRARDPGRRTPRWGSAASRSC